MRMFSKTVVGMLWCLLLMPASSLADNILSVEPISIGAGETKELTICLENDIPITLVQFDLKLPEGLTIPTNSRNRFLMTIAGRTTLEDHSLNASEIGQSYRFLLSSMTNAVLEGNSGPIIKVTLTADATFSGGTVILEQIELVSPDETAVRPASVSVLIGTPTSVMSSQVQSPKATGAVYDLNGRRISTGIRPRGLTIIGGRKMTNR